MRTALLATVALSGCCHAFANGNTPALVFSADPALEPKARVHLARVLAKHPDVQAILAMYALQLGAGCEGRDPRGALQCSLVQDLGLGAQCSAAHVEAVRSTFAHGLPPMGGLASFHYRAPLHTDQLKSMCYSSPDTATFQRIWTTLRVRAAGSRVVVSAEGAWAARDASGTFTYRTVFSTSSGVTRYLEHRRTRASRHAPDA